jgi:hypothetical protein
MSQRADAAVANELEDGAPGVGVDRLFANEGRDGPDPTTIMLASLGASFEDVQRTRKSQVLRAIAAEKNGQAYVAGQGRAIGDALLKVEQQVSRELKKALRKHALYPWLSQYPGLAGPTTARLLGIIADPMRFPGRKCEAGHYLPETYGGEVCQVDASHANEHEHGRTGADAVGETDVVYSPCLAPVHTRRGSGVRSLWHYLGLHAVDGHSPRKTRGQRCDWDPKGRTLVLQPDGLADQIVRQRTPVYRDVYDETKERLALTRAVIPHESDAAGSPGDLAADEVDESDTLGGGRAGGADSTSASDIFAGPLRPFQIDAIARKVAAKKFVGDLLIEWKKL